MSKFFQLFLFYCFLENNIPVSLGGCEDQADLAFIFLIQDNCFTMLVWFLLEQDESSCKYTYVPS